MKPALKSIRIDLLAAEVVILHNHLTEFITGSRGRILRLTNKKFELIDAVLAAMIGFKYSGLQGWQRVPSYFNENHWQLVREFHDLESRMEKMESSNIYLDKINKQLYGLSCDDTYTTYVLNHSLQELKWKQLSEKYVKFNAVKNELELKEILIRICRAYGIFITDSNN